MIRNYVMKELICWRCFSVFITNFEQEVFYFLYCWIWTGISSKWCVQLFLFGKIPWKRHRQSTCKATGSKKHYGRICFKLIKTPGWQYFYIHCYFEQFLKILLESFRPFLTWHSCWNDTVLTYETPHTFFEARNK